MSESRTQPSSQPDNVPNRDILSSRNPSVDWKKRNAFPRRLLSTLEKISLAIEKPVNHWVREQKFNPLYHTGTITVFLLFIILGTGIYLTMFYQFGFEASYEAVAKIEANFIGRVMRALHRYASGAAVIFALLHGWRTFFQDRFRGPRWLAWVSGVLMATLVWLIGISGYWLIWDQRAEAINQTLINLFQKSTLGTTFLVDNLVGPAAGSGWVFLVLVITVHLGLSALVGLFYWLHIKRLSRPKWLPPQYWMAALAGLLVLAALLIPVGMLAPMNPARLPSKISIDLFYLFYLPVGLKWQPLLFWGLTILVITAASILPWLLTRPKRPPVAVDPERCTGCTLCAADCPYQAITMIKRQDGKKHKFLAEINPKMCVACGICIGTCQPLAMTLSAMPAEGLWQETFASLAEKQNKPVRVVFACERHINQNRAKIRELSETENEVLQIVPLTCVGMAHPGLATQALENGAKMVHFVGCPPEDCANREGNLWLQQRLARERKPRLNQTFKNAPIYTDWLPPSEFAHALAQPNHQREATGYTQILQQIQWRSFIPALVLLALVLALQIWLSDRTYHPVPQEKARIEIVLDHQSGHSIQEAPAPAEPQSGIEFPTTLVLEIDGQRAWERIYQAGRSVAFEQTPLHAGSHHIKLSMMDRPDQVSAQILYENDLKFQKYDNLRLVFSDAPLASDPEAGRKLFFESSLGASASCHVCHSIEENEVIVGPSLAGVATRALTRKPGMTAEEYIKESITNPDAYIVDGFPAGLMLPDLEEKLSPAQIDNLVSYLLTLK